MPWNQGVYTPPAAAENAFAGKVIASADWNTIFTDIQLAFNQLAGAFVSISAVNFNSANTDNSIAIVVPTGFTRYAIDSVRVSGASTSLSTATVGLFTAVSAGGLAIVQSSTAITVTSTVNGASNNMQSLALVNTSIIAFSATVTPLYFRVQTAEGSAATGNVTLHLVPLP